MTQLLTPRKSPTRPLRIHPLTLCGAIFSGVGGFFALLGGVFMLVGRSELPRLFTAETWGENTPDELALPLIGLIFGAIGLIFLLTGLGMLLAMRRQRRIREELECYGDCASGTVTEVRIDRAYRVNNRHPLRILVSVRHPFTGETITVRSRPVWETALNPGDAVDVLFDPMNVKRYMVVLEQKQDV